MNFDPAEELREVTSQLRCVRGNNRSLLLFVASGITTKIQVSDYGTPNPDECIVYHNARGSFLPEDCGDCNGYRTCCPRYEAIGK